MYSVYLSRFQTQDEISGRVMNGPGALISGQSRNLLSPAAVERAYMRLPSHICPPPLTAGCICTEYAHSPAGRADNQGSGMGRTTLLGRNSPRLLFSIAARGDANALHTRYRQLLAPERLRRRLHARDTCKMWSGRPKEVSSANAEY